jgi:hypothetical protein
VALALDVHAHKNHRDSFAKNRQLVDTQSKR